MSDLECDELWSCLPDHILWQIFHHLKASHLLLTAQVCHQWNRVSRDGFLWRPLLYHDFKIKLKVPPCPDMLSWLEEYKRLHYHVPVVESEVLREHRDQVLHVCFSHDGKQFATCSKDGYVKVWRTSYPATLKYYANMKDFKWKYTQFSQYNRSDTLLLVSGLHFGAHSTSGEIAIFDVVDKFELQVRVPNKPYDVFGCWFNDQYLLSGSIYWRSHPPFSSASVLWLNKSSMALHSGYESVVLQMYKFLNLNASSVRTILVAEHSSEPELHSQCLVCGVFVKSSTKNRKLKENIGDSLSKCKRYTTDTSIHDDDSPATDAQEISDPYDVDSLCCSSSFVDKENGVSDSSQKSQSLDGDMCIQDTVQDVPTSSDEHIKLGLCHLCGGNYESSKVSSLSMSSSTSLPDMSSAESCTSNSMPSSRSPTVSPLRESSPTSKEKLLIFTLGTETYTPHQIGIKRITTEEEMDKFEEMRFRKEERRPFPEHPPPVHEPDIPLIEVGDDDELEMAFHQPDHIIELRGHIIGMALCPKQRYLYVNSRAWPQDATISNPLHPPPIAQEIDLHVFDLFTLKEVGTIMSSHKAYTPNDQCFFIFLDVCHQYVASGAEDHMGYVWDRHYCSCVSRLPHDDVVNCVAFNPVDNEVLVSVSDDHTIKIWRSLNREKEVKGRVWPTRIAHLTTSV